MRDETPLLALTDALDARRCGGKAANLARLVRAGFESAPAVVLPADTFEAHLRRCGGVELAELFESWAAMPLADALSEADALRDLIVHAPLSAELEASVAEACATLPPNARLAVRSSGVGEDGDEASFAGMFDSVLGVDRHASIGSSIRLVWASLFGRRLMAYAHDRGVRPRGIAVVLQEEVNAELSGVLFTRDPRARFADSVLVEYCAGLGERLVSGAITPTRLRIAKDTGAVVSEEEGEDRAALPPGTAASIVKLSAGLEACFGGPQDVEWCIGRDGRLLVLQSRPVTVPPSPAAVDTDRGPVHAWTNANISENYPEPIAPLLRSFVARGYAAYFRGLADAFGISRWRLDAMDDALSQLVGTHGGRLYYNLSHIHTVLHLAPGGPHLAKFFNQFTGATEFPAPAAVPTNGPSRAVELLRVAVCVPWRYARVDARVARFEREVDRYAAKSEPAALEDASMSQLVELVRGFLAIRLERWTDAALADTAAMVCYGTLDALLRAWLPARERSAVQNDLLKGLPGLVSATPVERLWALSRRVRANHSLRGLFCEGTAEAALAALDDEAHAELRAAFDDYLARWGFRYSGELMLTHATPREDPLPVLRLLQSYVREGGPGPAEASAAQARARLEATAEVERALTPNPLLRVLPFSRAGIGRVVLRATQAAIRLRERARMKQAMLYTRLRLVALAIGERLVARGELERADDVFYLSDAELFVLAQDGAARADSCAALVTERRSEERHWQSFSPPDRFELPAGATWTPGASGIERAIADDGESLEGTAACGGIAGGNAVVVLDVAEAHRVRSGDILVTRQTDPGWAAVFFLIEGLVIERGGMLSHGAIIAREYGIPAVVGVREATRRIVDGESIAVDGDHGRVIRHAL